MTRVASVFVGCKISQADSDAAAAELRAGGLLGAARREEADVVVVHTCCVTAEAERKSRRLARRWARAGKRVVVAGCAATLRPEQFEAPGVELLGERGWGALAAEAGGAGVGTRGSEGVAESSAAGRTRTVVKVQDGCAGACSYCAVRLVRGRPWSRPLADTIAAVDSALAGGDGEVVLSGVDLGSWREGSLRLADLVAAVTACAAFVEQGPRRRLRLSSLEVRHLDGRLLEALAHPAVARHLHLPLQSADDGVLAAMRRPYTFAAFREAAALARAAVGELMISTDVIVGFPTEDEAAFARTLAAIESGLFGRVHVFAYSPRPGTAAAELPPLPAEVVGERLARALAAAESAAAAARRAALGRRAEVLVEDRRDGLARGYSSEYMRYYVSGSARPGAMIGVVATQEYRDGVAGEPAE